jgi:hypothetical protein
MAEDACAPDKRHQFMHEGRVVYEWDQTLSDVNVYVAVPPGCRAKDLFCDIQPQSLRLGLKPNPPYLQVWHEGARLGKQLLQAPCTSLLHVLLAGHAVRSREDSPKPVDARWGAAGVACSCCACWRHAQMMCACNAQTQRTGASTFHFKKLK